MVLFLYPGQTEYSLSDCKSPLFVLLPSSFVWAWFLPAFRGIYIVVCRSCSPGLQFSVLLLVDTLSMTSPELSFVQLLFSPFNRRRCVCSHQHRVVIRLCWVRVV